MFLSIIYLLFIILLFFLFTHKLMRMLKVDKEEGKKREAEKIRKEAEESERKRKEAYHQKMTAIVAILNNQVDSIGQLYDQINDIFLLAENSLDKASNEYSERYYAPFWDQIELATNQLSSYNNYLHKINSHVDKYWSEIQDLDKEYSGQVKLCVLPGKLPDPQGIAQRLATTVRMAQKNFEFSTIYEQRKTNKLLYEGFSNLGDAIYSLGDRITNAINDLSLNLNSSLNEILSATNENSRIISDNIQEQTRRLDGHAEEQRRYESDSLRNQSEQQKTLEQQKRVLDSQNKRINNIQRGRKPGFFDE